MVRYLVSSKGVLVALLLGVSTIRAANDWSVPCLSGECSYDLPGTNDASSGTIHIWGAEAAIADVTTAAGWEILGCDPNALQQDIHLVCNTNSANAAGCQHLLKNGAEGKIVRLPENCGASAFARIARSYIPTDQSLPSDIAKRVAKRDDTTPLVRGLTLDTNFGAVDPAIWGVVNIAIRAANVPGAQTDSVTKRRRSHAREFKRQDVGDADDSLNEFDLTKEFPLDPVDINEQFNLFNQSLGCPPGGQASVNTDVYGKAKAEVSIGILARGTIVPPIFDDFAVFSNFNVDIDSSVTLTASATGSLDSGETTLFTAGIPGFVIPGILTLGPTFQIAGQVVATLDLNVDLEVGVKYAVSNGQFRFPPADGDNGSQEAFQIQDTPLRLSATPSVAATGSISAHVIPSLNLGVSAFSGVVEASVFLKLDASATVELSLEATSGLIGARSIENRAAPGNMPVAVGWRPNRGRGRIASRGMDADPAPMSPAQSNAMNTKDDMDIGGELILPSENTGNDPNDINFGGCFTISADFVVSVGADGSFFTLFDESTSLELFSKQFELFKRCFGAQAANARRSLNRFHSGIVGPQARQVKSRQDDGSGLKCPPVEFGALKTIADDNVKAADIRAQ